MKSVKAYFQYLLFVDRRQPVILSLIHIFLPVWFSVSE